MDIREQFRAVLARQPAELAAPELLPVRLARSAVAIVAGVDGVGISVVAPRGVRIPIGASDSTAATAERLQFSFGEGPCLQAADTGRPVFADAARFIASWPLLYDELCTRTPYRGVLALPLTSASFAFGSVNLNLVDDQAISAWSSDTSIIAWTVVEEIAAALTAVPLGRPGDALTPAPEPASDEPAWLDSPPAMRRQQVWIAVGMLGVQQDLNPIDSLAELRALAFSAGVDLDQYAADLVSRRIALPDQNQ